MKRIIFLVLLIAVIILGIVAGPALINYKGYFLVVLESGTFQLSIFGLLVSLMVLFLAGWLTLWTIRKLIRLTSGSQNWLFGLGQRKKQKAFKGGLISLAEGNYLEARRQFKKIEREDFDGINLLAAAEAEAQLNNKPEARTLWDKAARIEKTQVAAHLCILRDLIAENECKQALTYINNLSEKLKSNPAIIRLWARCLSNAQQFSQLKSMLPDWKKALGEEYSYWLLQSSKGEFAEIASKEGAIKLKQYWQSLPRAARKESAQRAAYAQQLIEQGMFEDAQTILVESQKSGPHPDLLPLFRQLKNPQPTAAKKLLESWLKQDDSDVEILSTLGELAFQSGDFVLAEKALSRAIKLANNKRDVLLMARIKEAQKDNLHALELYKQSAL